MTDKNQSISRGRWGRQRFLLLPTVQASSKWGYSATHKRILELVISNWLSADQPQSALQFRMKGKTYRKALEKLETQHLIGTLRDANNEGIYTPTLFGLMVAVAVGAKGLKNIIPACQRVFAAAKSVFKSNPTDPQLPYKKFLDKAGGTTLMLLKALQIIRDSGIGITVNDASGPHPTVYAYESILEYESLWEYFGVLANSAGSNILRSSSSGFPEEGEAFHFDDILAVVHNGDELVKKAVGQIHKDPGAAITAARSLVEATLKWILHDSGVECPSSASPAQLVKKCFPHIGFDGQHAKRETGIGQISSGIETALHGLAKLRDEMGDAHGRQPGAPSPTRRQARLAVGLAMTLSSFLVEAREAHKHL